MSSKDCSEVKQVAVSTACKKNNILQNSKVFSTKSHEYTRLFGSIADFFVRFTTLSFTSTGKIRRFFAPDQSKMISLHDSAVVYEVPPLKESICFSCTSRLALSPAVSRQNWTRLENKTPREIINMD